MRLVWDKVPTAKNGRNSEGSFIRIPDGSIMFAYSRYTSSTAEDDDACDIAAIRSYDEGETWTEPEVIVKAESFGVSNIMSVSCIHQKDGRIGVYFIIKENDKNSTFGRALSRGGKVFVAERISHNGHPAYYVVNNDRIERLSDGRLVLPAARHLLINGEYDLPCTTVLFVSGDDGKTWKLLPHQFALPALDSKSVGMQEPGVIEHRDGSIRVWARTMHGSQYESFSYDEMNSFTWPAPSIFTSPKSPMEIARNEKTGALYAIYNPYPQSQLSDRSPSKGRTPLVVRKSVDDGYSWSFPVIIEDTPDRGLCYPAAFFTKDNSMHFFEGNKTWGQMCSGILTRQNFSTNMETDDQGEARALRLFSEYQVYMDNAKLKEDTVRNLTYTSQEFEIKEQYEQTLNNYVREQIKLFVMGTKDINSEWNNYVKQVEELGLKAVLNMKQTAYDRASK